MARVVRSSKFRHVFGTAFKTEFTYQDLKLNSSAWDSCDFIKCNSTFFAIPWQSGGGGSLAVLKHTDTGKAKPETPCLSGHKAQILDFDMYPFNDTIIATGSEDCTVKIWQVPADGMKETIDVPKVSFDAHSRKVGLVRFHPTASNVLTTVGLEHKVKLWDIVEVQCKAVVEGFNDTVQALDYNLDGSQIVTVSKDKMVRLMDPRQKGFTAETAGHQGTKGSRVVWMKLKNKIFTVGFGKMSDRQYMIFDPRDMSKPIAQADIDMSSGLLMPFYDEDTSIMYLAGKGDGNIRYYEIVDEEPYIYYLSEFKTSSPQRGMAMMPKYTLDTASCEVARFYKLENTSVTPIMFQVPRKAESFQEDLYPDTFGPFPALTAAEYFEGKAAAPQTVSMRPENRKTTAPAMSDFKPKVEYKEPEKLPPKSNDPKVLMQQNDELRARIQALEKENAELRRKLADFSMK